MIPMNENAGSHREQTIGRVFYSQELDHGGQGVSHHLPTRSKHKNNKLLDADADTPVAKIVSMGLSYK